MTLKENNISLFSLKASDFNIPTLAFLAFFTYQYLFPQYFFHVLYNLEIPSISVSLCILYAVVGFRKKNINYVQKEVVCFLILGIHFFLSRYFVTTPYSTKIMFNQHLHQVSIGIVFVYTFSKTNKINLFTVLLILYASFDAFIGIREGGRIWGHDFLQDENQISAFMAMVIPVAYFYALYRKKLFIKTVCYIGIAVMTTLIIVSVSRGGFLALSTITFCILLYSKRKLLYCFIVVGGVSLVLFLAPPRFFDEINTLKQGTEESTASERVRLWNRAIEMFAESPIFGKGIHQFPALSHLYVPPGEEITKSDYKVCHSNWFKILSEMGLVGIICYSTLFIGYFKSWRRIAKTPWEKVHEYFSIEEFTFYKHIANGLGVGMIGYMVAGTFLNILTFPFFYLFIFFMMAVKTAWLTTIEYPQSLHNDSLIL